MSYYRPQVPDMAGRAIDTASKLYGLLNAPEDRRRKQDHEDMAMETARIQQESARLNLETAQEAKLNRKEQQWARESELLIDQWFKAQSPEERSDVVSSMTPDHINTLKKVSPRLAALVDNPSVAGQAAASMQINAGKLEDDIRSGRLDGIEMEQAGPGVFKLRGKRIDDDFFAPYLALDPERESHLGGDAKRSLVYDQNRGKFQVWYDYYKPDGTLVSSAPATRYRTKTGEAGADDDIISEFSPGELFQWAKGNQELSGLFLQYRAAKGDTKAEETLSRRKDSAAALSAYAEAYPGQKPLLDRLAKNGIDPKVAVAVAEKLNNDDVSAAYTKAIPFAMSAIEKTKGGLAAKTEAAIRALQKNGVKNVDEKQVKELVAIAGKAVDDSRLDTALSMRGGGGGGSSSGTSIKYVEAAEKDFASVKYGGTTEEYDGDGRLLSRSRKVYDPQEVKSKATRLVNALDRAVRTGAMDRDEALSIVKSHNLAELVGGQDYQPGALERASLGR